MQMLLVILGGVFFFCVSKCMKCCLGLVSKKMSAVNLLVQKHRSQKASVNGDESISEMK